MTNYYSTNWQNFPNDILFVARNSVNITCMLNDRSVAVVTQICTLATQTLRTPVLAFYAVAVSNRLMASPFPT